MLITESFDAQLDDLLERICRKLQISQTQRKLAHEHYDAVGKWLSEEGSSLANIRTTIYPQGSLRIGTTVKPLDYQEYDLDMVCELNIEWRNNNPLAVLNAIESRLKENEIYIPMIERKNRCIRLNYAGQFHMDILPACPNGQYNHGCVKVPDRETQDWKDSNPKGYAKWFENQVQLGLYESFAKRDIEPIPEDMLPSRYFAQMLIQNFPGGENSFEIASSEVDPWDFILPKDVLEDGNDEVKIAFFVDAEGGPVEMVMTGMEKVFEGPKPMVKDRSDVLHPPQAVNLQRPGPSNPDGAGHVILVDRPSIDEIDRLRRAEFMIELLLRILRNFRI